MGSPVRFEKDGYVTYVTTRGSRARPTYVMTCLSASSSYWRDLLFVGLRVRTMLRATINSSASTQNDVVIQLCPCHVCSVYTGSSSISKRWSRSNIPVRYTRRDGQNHANYATTKRVHVSFVANAKRRCMCSAPANTNSAWLSGFSITSLRQTSSHLLPFPWSLYLLECLAPPLLAV